MPLVKMYQPSTICCYLFIVISALYFQSCSINKYYAPNGHHLLRLQNKNDIKVESAFYRGALNNGVSAQAGYSPFKHIGLQANYSRSNSPDKRSLFMQEANIGVGAYFFNSFLDSLNIQSYAYPPGFLFDAYAGIGAGTNRNQYSSRISSSSTLNRYLKLNYYKYYLQFGIHYQSYRAIAISYTTRFLYLDYVKALAIGDIGSRGLDDFERLQSLNPVFLRENSFTMSIGGNKINYYFVFNFLAIPNWSQSLFYPSSMQTGIQFSLSSLFDKRNKPADN